MSWLQLSYIHSFLSCTFFLTSHLELDITYLFFITSPPLLLNLSFYFVVNNILLNKVLHSFAQGHFG